MELTIPEDSAFRVELPAFEGPLDLLLHLIRKHELDILDLPISFITERYLDYLNLMEQLDLDVASEYLLMAATLAHIKSKMLLPPSDDQQPDEDEELDLRDPRAELIRRLLEYQKYREAANQLGDRSVAGRDVFTRSAPGYEEDGPTRLAEVGLFKLLDAFEGILRRVKDRRSLEVTAERIGIQERISQITDRLRLQRNCTFEELFDQDHTRYDVVVTFLAILEMAKLRLARVYQAEAGAAIHVQYALLDADAPTVPPPGDSTEGAESRLAESVADLRVTSDLVEDAGFEEAGVEDDDDYEDDDLDDYEDDDDLDDDEGDEDQLDAGPAADEEDRDP